ncbi:MAG: cupin domain-containing protein [Verrucomicrobia bacterium]|nr:cupin domain-containing protein [Verrucomicrobiota bacterium]
MHRIRVADLPWEEIASPTKKFHSFYRNLSLALGGTRNAGTWGGGHPFDLQIRRLPPGASVCPYHLHLAQWEMFVVLAGAGSVRTPDGRTPITTGEVFFHPPGAAHQLTNTGSVDLEVLIIADNPPMDGCYYPDSDKWAVRPPGKIFRLTEVDYFEGEDALPAPGAPTLRAPPPTPAPAVTPFSQRKLHVDALAWDVYDSPGKKFRGSSKEVSIALGAKRNTPTALGGHPFDLELQKLPPGFAGCPFHSHAAQWELYFLLSGSATVRANEATHTLHTGEIVLHPPGEAHQITNASATDDLVMWVIADNPPVDYWHYPDSGKWGLRAPRKFFRLNEADYWDGEE